MFEHFQADATSFVTIPKIEKSIGVGYTSYIYAPRIL